MRFLQQPSLQEFFESLNFSEMQGDDLHGLLLCWSLKDVNVFFGARKALGQNSLGNALVRYSTKHSSKAFEHDDKTRHFGVFLAASSKSKLFTKLLTHAK